MTTTETDRIRNLVEAARTAHRQRIRRDMNAAAERQRRWETRCNVCRSTAIPTRTADPAPGTCPWCGHPPSALEAAVILTDLLDHQHPKGPPR